MYPVLEMPYLQKLRKILQYNKIYYILLFIALCYAFINSNIVKHYSVYKDDTYFNGIVTNFQIDGDKVTIQLKAKEIIQGTYYLKSEEEKNYFIDNLKYGIQVELNGTLNDPINNTTPNTFNYKKYLYNKGIYKILSISSFKIIAINNNVFYRLKNMINDRIKNINNSNYIKTFILGDKNGIDNDILSDYQTLGVTHLFAISGMHIGLFSIVILFILKKFNMRENKALFITMLIIGIYGALTGFPASIRRAYILFVFVSLNKIFDLRIKTIYLLILTVIVNIFLDSFIIYDIGFLYSVATTAGLIISKNFLKNGNYIIKLFKVSIISYLFSMPITINNFFIINPLSPINNLFVVPLVSLIIYPLSLITFIFPFLSPIFDLSINLLNLINNLLMNINIFNIVIPKWNFLLVIIYYCLLLFIVLKNKKKLLIIILLIVVVDVFLPYFDSNGYIYYLDVGQGDSEIIITPYKKTVTMIDTGGKISQSVEKWQIKNKNYHVTDNAITFMHSLGINKINNLILSHGDYDHMGDATYLVNNFKIANVVLNCGEYNDLEKELINILDKKKVKYLSCLKELTMDNYKLQFLNTGLYDNENDNSNVIYLNYDNYNFLFMGDASIKRENDILDKYNLGIINFLKVGHHGSNTSSSEDFINKIKPIYSLISVGKNNRYGHPNDSVLGNLEDSKIYRTDKDGSIMFKITNNKLKIETCAP